MLTVYLKKGRERPVLQGNPWIFSGSIDRLSEQGDCGSPCTVKSYKGERLGCGYYNGSSAIAVRIVKWGKESFDKSDIVAAVKKAVNRRSTILGADTDSCRLINSEGDFLPGLIVDKYAGGLAVQILTAGMERMRQTIIDSLIEACSPDFIYERSDSESRAREGIGESEGLLYGTPPQKLVIKENGLFFGVDIVKGQKTGFFFDQRQNRMLLRSYAAGRRCCDCFSYTGGFCVSALAGGALSVDAVDQSEDALRRLDENVAVNGFERRRAATFTEDVFRYLRETDRRYDCIILDPPKFARHAGEVERASRGYKDVNLLACKNILPGGLIFTFSCSGAIDIRLFRQIVFAAASDSGRRFQLLHTLGCGADHPVNLAHREGEYLKGLVLRAEE